jgi:hypothetical protein
MIPDVGNGQEHCGANVKESADVPKQSTALFDIARILKDAPYLHSLIISQRILQTLFGARLAGPVGSMTKRRSFSSL